MSRLDVQCFHILVITLYVFLGQFLDSHPAFAGMSNDIILDVGDILDVLYLVAPVFQVAADNVEKYITQGMTDMGIVIRIYTADIHLHLVALRYELLFFP